MRSKRLANGPGHDSGVVRNDASDDLKAQAERLVGFHFGLIVEPVQPLIDGDERHMAEATHDDWRDCKRASHPGIGRHRHRRAPEFSRSLIVIAEPADDRSLAVRDGLGDVGERPLSYRHRAGRCKNPSTTREQGLVCETVDEGRCSRRRVPLDRASRSGRGVFRSSGVFSVGRL